MSSQPAVARSGTTWAPYVIGALILILLIGGVAVITVNYLVRLPGLDHGSPWGLVVGLVHELGRVHADDHHGVAVLLLQLPELVQDMEAVDAAEGPEVQHHDLSAKIAERQFLTTGVEPTTCADQFRGAYTCTRSHAHIQPHPDLEAFPGTPLRRFSRPSCGRRW